MDLSGNRSLLQPGQKVKSVNCVVDFNPFSLFLFSCFVGCHHNYKILAKNQTFLLDFKIQSSHFTENCNMKKRKKQNCNKPVCIINKPPWNDYTTTCNLRQYFIGQLVSTPPQGLYQAKEFPQFFSEGNLKSKKLK